MSKFKFFFLAVLIVAGVNSANAQGQKTGYFNIETMIGIMPEAAGIDSMLQRYQADSINTEFAALVQDYNYKDSLLTKTDTTKIPPATRRQYRRDLEQIAYQVRNWQQISQNMHQQKQQQLVGPLYEKAYRALTDVAKENGYAFVYREEALMIAPPGDNLIPLVAKKLNIKLPNAQGAQGNQPTTRPPANSGRTTTRPKQ